MSNGGRGSEEEKQRADKLSIVNDQERNYYGIEPKKRRVTDTPPDSVKKTERKISTEKLEKLKPVVELKLIPLQNQFTEVDKRPRTPTSTYRKGFVREMAKKFEHNQDDNKPTNSADNESHRYRKQRDKESGAGNAVLTTRSQHPSKPSSIPPKRSVQDSVLAFEKGTSASHEEKSHSKKVIEGRSEPMKAKRERMVSIGTPESIDLNEIELPRWTSNRSSLHKDESGLETLMDLQAK
ncbi:hypothetical protein KIN20_006013 [Parelaphostrongylus tenuis]|nr:hypothetical protein KIN20_006013 [Parelaphostrongylus tenuis]